MLVLAPNTADAACLIAWISCGLSRMQGILKIGAAPGKTKARTGGRRPGGFTVGKGPIRRYPLR
jgi:hypothetical protein